MQAFCKSKILQTLGASKTMQLELKQIIAQESIKLIMEQSQDPSTACLEDFKQIQKLYSRICKLMNAQFNKKIKKIEDLMSKQGDEDPEAFLQGVQDELGTFKGTPTGKSYTGSSSQSVHTVKSGDTFWGLAKKYLGSGARWKEILDNNVAPLRGRKTMPARGMIPGAKGTDEPIPIIRPGDKLRIPPR